MGCRAGVVRGKGYLGVSVGVLGVVGAGVVRLWCTVEEAEVWRRRERAGRGVKKIFRWHRDTSKA